MKIYLVTYGNEKFKYSVKRLKNEANKISVIDNVFCFSEDDLPFFIKASPLFASTKGGGYWLWKPFIIKKVLEQVQEGDIVIYSDAGNKLFESEKWLDYIDFLKKYESVFFEYKENFDYGWSKFNNLYNDSPKLKYWVKKSTVEHFRNLFIDDDQWLEKSKIVAGFFLLKKTESNLNFIDQWLQNMLYFPLNVVDLFGNEKNQQIKGFSEHRHDQSILTILVRLNESKDNIFISNEEFETKIENQAVRTLRSIDKKEVSKLKLKIYTIYKYIYRKFNFYK